METHFSLNIGNQLKKRGKAEVKTTENMLYHFNLFCPDDINVKNYPGNVYYVTHRKLFG